MKKIKCFVSVILGLMIAICSSCKQKEQNGIQKEKDKQKALPEKEENLPIREPILE